MNRSQTQCPTSLTRSGFTLVELMIAMTITLLLMAGLAKSFTVIGESMKKGRSQVSLSSKLRGISFRLRSDLRSRTINVAPPVETESGQGYFTYYEGPLTEHTFGMFGASPQRSLKDGTVLYPFNPKHSSTANAGYNNREASPTYRRHSRFGDFDDYLAFTAEAPDGEWFTGKVPAYLVDDSATDPMAPTMIRSKYAEIIIWASPRWTVDPATNAIVAAPHPSAMPTYLDANNDYVPDNVVLHQRTLLIRPDLNIERQIPLAGNLAFTTNVLRPQDGNANPYFVPPALRRVYPIGTDNQSVAPAVVSMFPNYVDTGSDTDNRLVFNSNWLVGMAPLHQFFDLSLRRIVHPRTGEPTGYVAANSLQDLVQPHNRFAHVRYPGRYFNRGTFSSSNASDDEVTSMPLLATGWNDALLQWQGMADPRAVPGVTSAPGWFPTGRPSPRTLNTAGTVSNADDSRSGLFNGWLLPHFELGDPNPAGLGGSEHWQRGYLTNATAESRWDRTGEDVIASNVLSFDIKAFDRTAPVFITSGRDGQPGNSGVDDDGDGTANDVDETTVDGLGVVWSELGTVGTDDETINVSDLGVYDLLDQPILHPNIATTRTADLHMLGNRGAFADLLYPYLAGSPFQERTAQTGLTSTPPQTATANTQVLNNFNYFMQSDLSLFPIPTASSTIPLNSLKRSGKLVQFGTGGSICYMQPTYDTWTDGYESDGFDQTHTDDALPTGNVVGTTWVLNNVSGLSQTPRIGTNPGISVDTGKVIDTDPETSPPFEVQLPAVSIEVRVADPQTQEITQFTVIEALQ
jgi:prepilin-type N-terminal cleavage/methylation domain-containing protein